MTEALLVCEIGLLGGLMKDTSGRFGSKQRPMDGENHVQYKHGHTVGSSSGSQRSREYRAWRHAKDRCYNKNTHNYSRYGGRGIVMCDDWRASFRAFLRDMGKCPAGLTLERKQTSGNYEPGNCEWATKLKQARNQDRVVVITFNKKTMTASEWSEETGISSRKIRKRIQSGMPIEAALSKQDLRFC